MAARGTPRRERLEELLKLAQLYRGWPVRRLAEELGRDPHNLVPDSGVPKIDLVMRGGIVCRPADLLKLVPKD